MALNKLIKKGERYLAAPWLQCAYIKLIKKGEC